MLLFYDNKRCINKKASFFILWAFLQRRVSLVDQERFILQGHLSSPSVFSGVGVAQSFVLYVCFVDHCLCFCTFLLAIVLSVRLRYAVSIRLSGTFKLLIPIQLNEYQH